MPRVKTVFRNSAEVAHIWVQQTHAEGRCANVFFEGETIYSYGRHFPMAKFYTVGGRRCVLRTTRRYSNTTNKHQGDVWRALNDLGVPIYFVQDVDRTPLASDTQATVTHDINEALTKAARAHKNGASYLAEAQRHADNANGIAAFFKFRGWKTLALDADSITKAKEYNTKQQAALRARMAKAKEGNAVLLQAWRDGADLCNITSPEWDASAGYMRDYPVMLRINGEDIQTSRGAFVPIEHAKKLWPQILKVRERGEPFVCNGHTIHIGHYSLDRIEKDGTIKAGCHVIPFAELALIAEQLGLAEQVTT